MLQWVYTGKDSQGQTVEIRIPYGHESIADIAQDIMTAIRILGYTSLTEEYLGTELVKQA